MPQKMEHLLSKSTFVKGNQCHKALYLNRYHRDLRDEIDAAQQAIFDQGHQVGMLARQLFPGGIDLTPTDYSALGAVVKQTISLVKQGVSCLYEPAFLHQEVFAAMDILVKGRKGWTAYEVKSSTGISDTYVLDAALQYFLITGSGIKVTDICIVHINNQYVKNGSLDLEQMFTIESVLDRVLELQEEIPAKIEELKNVLRQKAVPKVDIGPYCKDPYDCDFMGHCWKHVPENSVFNIANLRTDKKWKLYEQGIVGFDQIDLQVANAHLNEKQRMQLQAEKTQKAIIDRQQIRSFIASLRYPLYFLDFETFQLAVPIFNGTRPYEQLVFQYSLHCLPGKKSEARHSEFLAEVNGKDPRPAFIENLIADCGKEGDILVYNIGFERSKLNALIRDFPKYKVPLQQIVDRLKDLMVPFQKRWYYVPAMRGSYSIKNVLPALVPELSYENLAIGNGDMAKNVFGSMLNGTLDGDPAQTRKDLLEYCKMDTWAMVRLFGRLKQE